MRCTILKILVSHWLWPSLKDLRRQKNYTPASCWLSFPGGNDICCARAPQQWVCLFLIGLALKGWTTMFDGECGLDADALEASLQLFNNSLRSLLCPEAFLSLFPLNFSLSLHLLFSVDFLAIRASNGPGCLGAALLCSLALMREKIEVEPVVVT